MEPLDESRGLFLMFPGGGESTFAANCSSARRNRRQRSRIIQGNERSKTRETVRRRERHKNRRRKTRTRVRPALFVAIIVVGAAKERRRGKESRVHSSGFYDLSKGKQGILVTINAHVAALGANLRRGGVRLG